MSVRHGKVRAPKGIAGPRTRAQKARSQLRQWVRRLESQEEDERWEAAENPPAICGPAVVPYLIRALADKVSLVRVCAAESLQWYRVAEARQAIIRQLARETDPLARAYCLSTLGSLAERCDIPRLFPYTSSGKTPIVRLHAAVGLCWAAYRQAREVVYSVLETGAARDRGAAASIAQAIGGEQAGDDELLAVLKAYWRKERWGFPKSAMREAIMVLRNAGRDRRRQNEST